MKTKIDIITGFIGAGKTTYINRIIKSNSPSEEKIVVLQNEIGEEEIKKDLGKDIIIIDGLSKENSLEPYFIIEIIEKYLPDRLIIEHNGMSKLEDLLVILDDRALRKKINVNRVINIIDPLTFDMFINNMGSILREQIASSDTLIINDTFFALKEKIDKVKSDLKKINRSANIVCCTSIKDLTSFLDKNKINKKSVIFTKSSNIFLFGFVTLFILFLLINLFKSTGINSSRFNFPRLQEFSTIFLSILIQALPFILFGTFISAIIQVFISEKVIEKHFPQHGFEGFLFAIFAGLIFPVCDCAIVPVAGRLIKKGVSVSVAVTFMLAAPIVNPIVIASTYYAFPGQHFMAFYRVIIGIAVAMIVGITFKCIPAKGSILAEGIDSFDCNCGYCDDAYRRTKGILGKINAIIKHAGSEFFQVGQYLILGAFLSTIMQTVLPKVSFVSLSGVDIISLLVMMLAAFVLSVCSTSDAFIARSFVNQFSLSSIMGFLVLGPMIDIKNLLMLLGNFQKRFVIKLVCIIFITSFFVIYFLTSILL